ncbi:carboxymuconolactone decarboxylase family protein [Streptomyces sp. R21]|uniref:Carboxymuconolactone decarboxylase family protein n=1 Tax=Streptomyces sp. R21 TaxID=3238627 RepID=A0AB39PL76_9ACTN
MPTQPSRAQQLLGDLAPKMVQLTDDVLFGDVWEREGLSPRDRSLITVAVLAATYRPGGQFPPGEAAREQFGGRIVRFEQFVDSAGVRNAMAAG